MQRFVRYIATKRGMRDSLRLLLESNSPLFAETSGLCHSPSGSSWRRQSKRARSGPMRTVRMSSTRCRASTPLRGTGLAGSLHAARQPIMDGLRYVGLRGHRDKWGLEQEQQLSFRPEIALNREHTFCAAPMVARLRRRPGEHTLAKAKLTRSRMAGCRRKAGTERAFRLIPSNRDTLSPGRGWRSSHPLLPCAPPQIP